MCGRYAMMLRFSQVQQMLQDDDVPVAYAPDDDGEGSPRQSYNFAPGYHGIVYRADISDRGAGPRRDEAGDEDQPETEGVDAAEVGDVKYKLQSMKWGLVPFWTKRNPDYGSLMKTINCRDDSLGAPGGMWTTMKARKRCIVIAQGFFEWLKTGPKDKLPHFVKRKDGQLMCFAGLWDCVQYEGSEEKLYTYTIITTDSNTQLKFLHDRMPVIFDPSSDNLRKWVDPSRYEWTRDLQSLLKPFEGDLDVYPVSKDVGKVGNNSPSFIIPLDSKENKANIKNFFANAREKGNKAESGQVKKEKGSSAAKEEVKEESQRDDKGRDIMAVGEKRKTMASEKEGPPAKKSLPMTTTTPMKTSPMKMSPIKMSQSSRGKISATHNDAKSPAKAKAAGSQKITKFFGNSG